MKKMDFATVFAVLILLFLTSCGRVTPKTTRESIKETDYLVKIEVGIKDLSPIWLSITKNFTGPWLFIKAGETESDKKELELTDKFLTSADPYGWFLDDGNLILTIQEKIEAVFPIPLVGRITIRHNGKTEIFERYGKTVLYQQF